ncbi:Na+:solute symporter [Verrucomicrobiaceae bacterium 5K15]|uniref:Na+:solute symporter n=1 Tax=Oceaniferula flava TaxID=2800421 RepID=A0AAE2VBI9_9BACT|nr:sodium:solute symporter family protein [Oceaniferula flavus]MBK1853826.1 Na+:solute symporter [Oceaniferula flavus]MBM1135132.1 Na+:solute symporter [Oceaniferula flavus]
MHILAEMKLAGIDWTILISFFAVALGIGVVVSRQSGKSSGEFFLSGRHMPWWLLGFSMVATTFSTDTPNFVTDLVRTSGVWANWMWWAFIITGMLTVFIYAKLWRRSEVLTDVEFYELRYSGKSAAFLRGFRAIYLGVLFNIIIMASVSLAAIKIGETMLGWGPGQSVVVAMVVTVIFSSMGGFKGVILTDFLLFIIAMVGAFAAAYYAVSHPDIGGLDGLFNHEAVKQKLNLFPTQGDWNDTDTKNAVITLFVLPLAIQWWSVWYPGAEPGGGGYLAQRMLAAKNEKHAVGATLFFQVAHYAIRPWPWIIVALASLVVFPEISDIQKAFPDAKKVAHDSGYPAMLTFLPAGWLGLVLTSLVAAYMSTISTHLNWGSSYVVNDFWKRFIKPDASEKQLVLVGRVSTVVMMGLTALLALSMESALDNFKLITHIGAGTGLLFILRWFWWRINPASEIAAMLVSFAVAMWLRFGVEKGSFEVWQELCLIVGITTAAWLLTALFTKPSDTAKLRSFIEKTNPGGPGWKKIITEAEQAGTPIKPLHDAVNLPLGILNTVLGCVLVYGILLGSGLIMYGQTGMGGAFVAAAVLAGIGIIATWKKSVS